MKRVHTLIWMISLAGNGGCALVDPLFESGDSLEDEAPSFASGDRIHQKAMSLRQKGGPRMPQSLDFSKLEDQGEYPDFIRDALNQGEVALGMDADQVRSAWGDPREIRFAGEPSQQNEQWIYVGTIFTTTPEFSKDQKMVFFEKGRVVGWIKGDQKNY